MDISIGQSGHKVMIIGIDGCSLNIIERMIAEGELPHFAHILRHGSAGKLKSTVPPSSPAAWSTFQTGVEPGKHGIFDFFRNSQVDYSYHPVNATYFKAETFWQRLSRRGKKVGVVNFLFTYPPRPINGFVVTGKETPSERVQYTYPESLKEELLSVDKNYKVESFKRVSHSRSFLKAIPRKLDIQERINSHLIRNHPTDIFMNMFSMPDILQHVFWRHMDPEHPLHDKREAEKFYPLIVAVFNKLDEIIGGRLKMIDDDTTVIIMSDHGGCGVSRNIQLNYWLRQQRLLFLNDRSISGDSRSRLVWERIRKFDQLLVKIDTFGLRRWLKQISRKKRSSFAKENLIDWDRTMAYVGRLGEGGIYCNLKGREKHGIVTPGEEYELLRDKIVTGLRELKDPRTGARVFTDVARREDIYHGPYVKFAPDIIVQTGDAPYQESDKLIGDELFEDFTKSDLSGKHHPYGLVIVHGRGIKKRFTIQEAHIRDIAPTVLYMMGETIPRDMDGRVLVDLFEEDIINGCPVQFDEEIKPHETTDELVYQDADAKEVEERLKGLGYL